MVEHISNLVFCADKGLTAASRFITGDRFLFAQIQLFDYRVLESDATVLRTNFVIGIYPIVT
jgi:hypothetical protein